MRRIAAFAATPTRSRSRARSPTGEPITLYTIGEFTDLCRGGHADSTGRIGAFKLMSVAGAYWRGDEHKPMLQRIYGTAWHDAKQLDAYLARLEEAQRRDHRKLGAELELFSIEEDAGGGLVFWHPKGAVVRGIIENFIREGLRERGYQPVVTPHIVERTPLRDLGAPREFRAEHVRPDRGRGAALSPQADELPRPHPDLPEPLAQAIAICRSAFRNSERYIASSARACFTG